MKQDQRLNHKQPTGSITPVFSVHAYLKWWMEKKKKALYLYLELNEVKLSQPTGAGVVTQRQGLA